MKIRNSIVLVILLGFAFSVAIPMAASAADPASLVPKSIRESGVLKIGSQQTYPPIEFRDPATNKMTGLSTDLLTEVAKRLGLKLEWIQSDYGALITGAMASRFDIASGGISDQPKREEKLDFVNYLKVGTGILVHADVIDQYKSIEDFGGKKVAFTLGAKKIEAAVDEGSEKAVAMGRPPIGKVMLPNSSDAKMQLDLKRVEGYLNETPTLAYLMKQKPGQFAMVGNGDYILAPLITSWGFTKKNTKLRDAVQAVMTGMLKDGTYKKIMTKWELAGGMLPEITINVPWDARK